MVEHARNFLSEKIDWKQLGRRGKFLIELDSLTDQLSRTFPGDGKANWGAARKALNIFLATCVRDHRFMTHHRLRHISKELELPLDRYAIEFLRMVAQDEESQAAIGKFKQIKKLKKPESDAIQNIAASVAKSLGCLRHELDFIASTDRDQKLLATG